MFTGITGSESIAQSGAAIYINNCSGCHGAQLQGSIATALIEKELKHGSDRSSIIKVIRNGIPSTPMMKWQGVLSDQQIEAVTDFIISSRNAPEKVKSLALPNKVTTKDYKLNIETLVTQGMSAPWGIEFVDATRALVTGKSGELRWMVNGKLVPQPVRNIPQSYGDDMVGGMMDLALDPDYAKNGWIYLGFSHNNQNSKDKSTPGMTKIVRGKVRANKWVEQQDLFQVADSLLVTGGSRWGCRLLIDKEGYLFFTIGDMNRADDSQNLSVPSGKIYRIHRDGSIPRDNPLYGQTGKIQAIYSWGNRNAQGLAQHPETGTVYATEHGPQGGDELNILRKGANYGWPVITYGIDYDGSIISKDTAKAGMEQPITYWTPSIAVCAAEFVTSNKFSRWKNNLLVTALKFQEIRRLVVDEGQVKEQEIILKGYGRIRDVKFGPDGALYVLTNGPDGILRITPQ